MKEELIALGKALQSDFDNLISQQITGCLTNDFLIDADWRQLAELEAELSSFFEINDQFAALEMWLTSGFIPGELPDFGLVTEEWTTEAKDESLGVSPSPLKNSSNLTPGKQRESGFIYSTKPKESISIKKVKNRIESEMHPSLETKDLALFQKSSTPNQSAIPDIQEVKNRIESEMHSPLETQDLAHFHETSTPNPSAIPDIKDVKNRIESEMHPSLETQDLAEFQQSSTPNLPAIPYTKEVKDRIKSEMHPSLETQDLAEFQQSSTPNPPAIPYTKELKNKIESEIHSPLGLKHLANFLASEPYDNFSSQDSDYWEELQEESKIESSDMIPKMQPQTDHFNFESDRVANYPANSQTAPIPELFMDKQQQYQDRELQMEIEANALNNFTNTEIDIDLIFAAIAQEINREYRRFYGS